MMIDQDELAALEAEILKHKRLYTAGSPILSDSAYDALEEKMASLCPGHPILKMVGSDLPMTKEDERVHNPPMLSLEKTYEVEDLFFWQKDRPLVGAYKIDGNSLSLIYEHQVLKLAKTRGNGTLGEDVTSKILHVSHIPKILKGENIPQTIEIRGEIFCRDSDFQVLVTEMESRGLEKAISPRNIVAGILGRKSHQELARFFDFFAFDLLGFSDLFQREEQKEPWLKAQGFKTPPQTYLETKKDIEDFLAQTKKAMQEEAYGIDGAVFSFSDLNLHKELGWTAHHPRYRMAFKWPGLRAQVQVLDLFWTPSRMGILTPVALIEPTFLSGATIRQVTLHNLAFVTHHQIAKGAIIDILRAGEVIPKCLGVVKQSSQPQEIPVVCPSCGTVLDHQSIRLICPNKESCAAQTHGAILHWIKTVGIEDLSTQRLDLLIAKLGVQKAQDLYRLQVFDFLTLDQCQETMAKKLYHRIQASKKMPLWRFLSALGIPKGGSETWKKILSFYPSLEAVQSLTVEALCEIKGFRNKKEKTLAQTLILGLQNKAEEIEAWKACGITFLELEQQPQTKKGPLSGLNVVLTGTMDKPRKEIISWIESLGGLVKSSVTKNTDMVIQGDGKDQDSTKTKAAQELGVKVVSFGEFFKNIKDLSEKNSEDL